MFSLATAVVTAGTIYFLKGTYLGLIVLPVSIYYLFRKNEKVQVYVSLNFILASAILIFGTFRNYGTDYYVWFLVANYASILYDLLRKWYWSIPLFGFSGFGLALLGRERMGIFGYILGWIVVPLVLKLRKEELKEKEIGE